MRLIWFLVFALFPAGSNANNTFAAEQARLAGIWKEELNPEGLANREVAMTFVFSEDSDLVMIVAGYGSKNRVYRYTLRGDSIFVHKFLYPPTKDYVGTFTKEFLNFYGVNYKRQIAPALKPAYDEIIVFPTSLVLGHYAPRFYKFALFKNGYYQYWATDYNWGTQDGSGTFDQDVFPFVYTELSQVSDFSHSDSRMKFKVEFYKKGKLKRTVNNTGDSGMKWIFQFLNQHTY